jgi:hypothetical protein
MAKFIATLLVPSTTYFRTTAAPRQKEAKPPSPRQAAMLLARRPEKLKPAEQQLLAKLNECCPDIPILYDLTQGFAAVFRGKQSDALQNWVNQARGTGLSEIGRFCDGLRRDENAVNAAVILPWSNGQVEGQIHRLKLVKRQMYGRANPIYCAVGFCLMSLPPSPSRHKAHLDLHGNCGRTQSCLAPKGSGPNRTKPHIQRCAVRVTYMKNVTSGQWRAYGRYVAGESATHDGDAKAVGFDGNDESIEIAERLERWQKEGDELLWKLIISPEFGDRADLKGLTRDLLSRMERDLGTPLQWVADVHYNAEHPNVHVALRGTGAELSSSQP